jgi:hypothetical protein
MVAFVIKVTSGGYGYHDYLARPMVTFTVTVTKVTSVCWLLCLPETSRSFALCGQFLKILLQLIWLRYTKNGSNTFPSNQTAYLEIRKSAAGLASKLNCHRA